MARYYSDHTIEITNCRFAEVYQPCTNAGESRVSNCLDTYIFTGRSLKTPRLDKWIGCESYIIRDKFLGRFFRTLHDGINKVGAFSLISNDYAASWRTA